MTELTATHSGTLAIGGDLVVNRLGFGAMRITGKGVWGEPADRDEALRVLRRLPELGVNFIDTADSYGPFVSEDLIREALHPYDGIVVATKGGFTRHGPDQWEALGRPDILEKNCHSTCPASLIETAKMYNPNMKVDILAIPPRVSDDNVCCKWKLSMRDESDPQYVPVELTTRPSKPV